MQIVIPSTTRGLFQIEGRSRRPNGAVQRESGVVILTLPPGERYLGFAERSPLTQWHQLRFVDETGAAIPCVESLADLKAGEVGVVVSGIAGRSELSWFAIGDRDELVRAVNTRAEMLMNGQTELQ